MTGRVDQEMRNLRRAGQRLETASKEWSAAYREYLGAMHALSQKTLTRKAPKSERRQGSEARRTKPAF
jgi:hypothetical protein